MKVPSERPGVAMMAWPDRFEDFHDRLGVDFETFRTAFTGSWVFGYVEALQRAGVRPILYFVSARLRDPLRFTHVPTGAAVRILPAPRAHQKLRGAMERFGIRLESLRSVGSYLATPLRGLARALREDGCDVILCQEYEYARFDVAVALGRLLRLPVFATFQGGEAPRSRIEVPLRRMAVRRAAGLIIPSSAQAARARRRYRLPASRVATIPNPLDVGLWRPGPTGPGREELGISPDAPVVTWQGRISIDQKGLDILVTAWPRVWEAHGDRAPLLLLVGDGQDAERFRAMLADLPDGSVRWVDRFVHDRATLWRYLTAGDVAVLPSRREGFPVAAVEAMASGLPLVAADAPGVVDALGSEGDAGIIVPREDPEALAAALSRLISDEVLARALGRGGRRRAEAQFSLDAVGARLRDVLFPPEHAGFGGPSPRL